MSELQSIFNGTDNEPFAYIGRGVRRSNCLAFRVVSLPDFMAQVVSSIQDEQVRIDPNDIRSMKVDRLGMDMVVYFPYIKFVESNEDSDK